MKGKIFRIAHLGFFDYMDTIALLGALEFIARDTLKLPVQLGQGLAAAQQVFADRKPNQVLDEVFGQTAAV
jgi:aspartate aminotransferase-like enzyme